MKVAIIGAGSWGTAVANIAAENVDAVLWARRPELATSINDRRENCDYLPGLVLHPKLRATDSIAHACAGADAVVVGVPSHGLRSVLEQAVPCISTEVPVLSLAKGIEQHTLDRMTQVIASVLVGHNPDRIGVLTGPNLAKEIVSGQPAASVIAMGDPVAADMLQNVFMTPTFRVYTNPDVVGCEIAGALKNVVAIAVGIAHGLGYGDNAKAGLITRGLAELARLGMVMGGDSLTFAGLAGMGDLIATCSSPQSRNRSVGVALGEGRKLSDIIAEMNMVAEGVKTTEAVLELARRHGIDLPIAEFVGRILYEDADAATLVPELMLRSAKSELDGMR